MTKIDYKNNVLNYDLKKESRLLQLIEDSVYIDENSRLGDLAWVRYGSTIINSRIGDVAFIGFNCKIENTIIGNYCQIATGSYINGNLLLPTIVEDNVWIGARVFIAPGIRIGSGSIIGAGTYVTQDIERNSVVYGRGVVTIKKRDYIDDHPPDIREILELKIKRLQKNEVGTDLLKDHMNIKDAKKSYSDADIQYKGHYEIDPTVIMIGRKDGPAISGGIEFGHNAKVMKGCILEAAGGINIGDSTVLHDNVLLISNTHDLKYKSLPWREAKITIGKNVIIGQGTTIIGPCEIPDNSIVMPQSLIVGRVYKDKYIFGFFRHS